MPRRYTRAWLPTRFSVPRSAGDDSATASNIRLLYWDVACFGVLFGVVANFIPVFVARLNPSPWLLSAVTSGPALINILWQLWATRIVERTPNPQRITLWTALQQRFGYLLMALIPWLLPPAWQGYAIVGVLLAQGLPGAILAVAFSTMFSVLVPRERKAAVVGTRNALLGVTSMVMVAACGVILTVLPFPLGYQAILTLGFLGSLGSVWALARLRTAAHFTPPEAVTTEASTVNSVSLRRDVNFVRFAAGAFLLHLGMFMTAPLFPLYWVQSLHLSDGWISSFAAVLSLTGIAGSIALRGFVYRWRISGILGVGCLMFGLYPALTSQLTNPWIILLVAAFSGLWNGIIGVSLFNAMTEVCPPSHRARYIGVYTWLMNIAIFAAPIAGALFANLIGVSLGLICAGIMRFAAGLIFLRLPFATWEVAHPAPTLQPGH